MKPPFTYFGGKTAVADRIVALLPGHHHYVEPFAGSLAVLLAKPASPKETVNDLDGDLVNFWRVLRDRPSEFIRACAMTPHSRAEYEASYEGAEDDMERARRTWVTISQGRSGTLRRTGWRYAIDPGGRVGSVPGDLRSYVSRMEAIAQRLSTVTLECRPALEVARSYGVSGGVLLYVDPPYLGSLRALNYQHEMPAEAEHEALAEALRDCRATVVVSGYHSPLYERLYAGWHQAGIGAFTGNGADGARTEVIWSNRPFPQGTLFDHLDTAATGTDG